MYEMSRIVTSSDCDENGIQSVVSIITMMQDCSGLWLEGVPEVFDWVKANHLALILTSRQLDVYRRPAYRERLTVRTWPYQFRGPLGYRNTVIYDADEKIVACCWCTGPFIDLAAGKMIKAPAEIIDAMDTGEKLEMEYLPRRIALPEASEFETLDSIAVRPSDIDYYRHVNNAQYVRMACDLLPVDFEFNRMRIEYKAQAKLGMSITPRACHVDGKVFVCLDDDEGKPFAEIEISRF